jgi:hypothetical protein
MMVDRRTFIQGAALVATTPVLEALLSFSSTVQSHVSLLACTPPPQMAGDETAMSSIVFKIDGWDRCDELAMDRLSANTVTRFSDANQVLIRINQSWRTAWR